MEYQALTLQSTVLQDLWKGSNMQKYFFTAFFVLAVIASGFSQEIASITYTDGWVDIKDSSGITGEAFIGDSVYGGNSVITGENSYAELLEESGSTYKISPETIFTVREMEIDGERQGVLSCVLGEISFKFNRIGGTEPLIATNSTTAGIRGTEFTVYAGADGSSFISVTSGLVEVEAEGVAVLLNPDEAVDVRPGDPPGEKIQLLGRVPNFSQWNEQKKSAIYNDPVSSLEAIEKRLDYYNKNIEELYPEFLKLAEITKEHWAEYEKIYKEKGETEAFEFQKTVLAPSTENSANMSLNVRYYALSALSMRRFIVGNMYGEMKSRFITDLENPKFKDFITIYNRVLDKFEKISIPRLNETDI